VTCLICLKLKDDVRISCYSKSENTVMPASCSFEFCIEHGKSALLHLLEWIEIKRKEDEKSLK